MSYDSLRNPQNYHRDNGGREELWGQPQYAQVCPECERDMKYNENEDFYCPFCLADEANEAHKKMEK